MPSFLFIPAFYLHLPAPTATSASRLFSVGLSPSALSALALKLLERETWREGVASSSSTRCQNLLTLVGSRSPECDAQFVLLVLLWVERLLKMTLEERRKEYLRDYVLLKDIPTWMEDMKSKSESDDKNTKEVLQVKKSLSEKVSLYRGDITLLEVDAIVNAGRISQSSVACASEETVTSSSYLKTSEIMKS
uniref:Mono-ADP ribosylhydrolase 2 n=2 Tax=Crocodylus porosus TaxID=8502 RepID=A0A7M4F1P5_CROPO